MDGEECDGVSETDEDRLDYLFMLYEAELALLLNWLLRLRSCPDSEKLLSEILLD